KALHDGGVPVIFGTDAPQQFSVPGFSVHREMALMLRSGLTPYQVLLTATRNAGEYHKDKARFGTVAAGSRADLILVDGDPLKDLSNVARRAGVMVRGRWLAEGEIQKRLAGIAAPGKP
ncbi:MAG TPA: amidohydrolase family protein, partial [Pyrinomonadaceae bacterium]